MNKQTAQKAAFLIQGLLGRLEDGAAFFEGLRVVFTSGTKEFALEAEWDGSALCFCFSGERFALTREAFCRFISERIPEYDAMVLTYLERGKCYLIEADKKGVSTKTAEAPEKKVPSHVGKSSVGAREYYISPTKAADVLRAIGILGQNGKIKNDNMVIRHLHAGHGRGTLNERPLHLLQDIPQTIALR